MATALHRVRTAEGIKSAGNATALSQLKGTIAGLLPFYSGSLSSPDVTFSKLSAEVLLNVAAMENYTVALNVAYGLLRLFQNTTTLTSALQDFDINGLAVEIVQVQFLHPVEGLVVV